MMSNFSPSTSRKMYEQQQQLQQQQMMAPYKVTRNPEYEDPSKLRLIQQMKLNKMKEKGGMPPCQPPTMARHYSHEENRSHEPPPQTLLLQNLTSRLGQMHNNKAHRVRSLINSRTVKDPTVVHSSLMDQIKRGTRLRTTPTDERPDFP
jgi:hypothetical protein